MKAYIYIYWCPFHCCIRMFWANSIVHSYFNATRFNNRFSLHSDQSNISCGKYNTPSGLCGCVRFMSNWWISPLALPHNALFALWCTNVHSIRPQTIIALNYLGVGDRVQSKAGYSLILWKLSRFIIRMGIEGGMPTWQVAVGRLAALYLQILDNTSLETINPIEMRFRDP